MASAPKANGRALRRLWLAGSALGALTLGSAGHAIALPTGAANATNVTVSSAGKTTTASVTAARAYVEWNSFNIAAGENFNVTGQTSPKWILVNKVVAGTGSTIAGGINAPGQVWIIDPHGITVNSGASIDVGGLLLSSAKWTTSDESNFLTAGSTTWSFTGQTGQITMDGTIATTGGGVIALLGPTVTIGGSVNGGADSQILAVAAKDVTLNFADNGTYFSLNDVTIDRGYNGGQVNVTASHFVAADRVVVAAAGETSAASIVITGALDATKARTDGQDLVLFAADGTGADASPTAQTILKNGAASPLVAGSSQSTITVNGSIYGSSLDVLAGGAITDKGYFAGNSATVISSEGAFTEQNKGYIDTTTLTGSSGGASTLDGANDVTRLSNFTAGGALAFSDDLPLTVSGVSSTGAGVSISSSGALMVAGQVTGAAGSAVSLTSLTGLNVLVPITAAGDTLNLTSTYMVDVEAPITVRGAGVVNVSAGVGQGSNAITDFLIAPGASIRYTDASGNPLTASAGGAFSFNGAPYTLEYSFANLVSAVNANPSGAFALGQPVTAGSYTAAPIPMLTGSFAGLGNPINGLTITGASSNAGLIGQLGAGGSVVSVDLVGGSVSGGANVGDLIGTINNNTLVSNSYATGTVSGSSNVGGLVGETLSTNGETEINASYANGAVSGGSNVGGLVGMNGVGSGETAIQDSYASGAVIGTGSAIGGLVGLNEGFLSNTYAIGMVAGGSKVGGLVGENLEEVDTSYASGAVSGAGSLIGGLVGSGNGNVFHSYWDTGTTGQSTSAGGTGLTTAAFRNPASFSGFGFGRSPGEWVIVDNDGTLNGSNGGTRPILAMEYSTVITDAHQLQLIAMNTTAGYTLASSIDASGTSNPADVWGGTTFGGFLPLGSQTNPFTGTLDGINAAIIGLAINRPSTDFVGLFGALGATGVATNFSLNNPSITGHDFVGAVVGYSSGNVNDVLVLGGSVSANRYGGGLIGYNDGFLGAIFLSDNVSGIGSIGGAVGQNSVFGTVSRIETSGQTVTGVNYVGGLVGLNEGIVDGSNVASTNDAVTGTGDFTGGLIGYNYGAVVNGMSAGSVNGVNYTGGLIGYSAGGAITNGSSTATVAGASVVGGLVGELADGTVVGSTASGQVQASGNFVGGLVGDNLGTITTSSATGQVSGLSRVGGLVGLNGTSGVITDITAAAMPQVVNGTTIVGGLVGQNSGEVGSNATPATTVADNAAVTATGNFAGGLVGYNTGAILYASAEGSVQGADNVGGLAGRSDGSVSNASTSANVTATDVAGGLIGYNTGTVATSTATGSVSATGARKGPRYGVNTSTSP